MCSTKAEVQEGQIGVYCNYASEAVTKRREQSKGNSKQSGPNNKLADRLGHILPLFSRLSEGATITNIDYCFSGCGVEDASWSACTYWI